MGEMADFALEEVEIAEGMRDDYINGRMSDNDAYEHGILDETGGCNFNPDNYTLDSFTPEDLHRDIKDHMLTLQRDNKGNDTLESIKKYHTKWSMLRGMRDHVLKGRPLSEKQKKWLSTNITFNVNDFPRVCKENKAFRDKIEYYWKVTSGQRVDVSGDNPLT